MCGDSSGGRLGIPFCGKVCSPRQIPGLSQFVIKNVAVHSGGKHAIALSFDGKVSNFLLFAIKVIKDENIINDNYSIKN